MCEQCRKLDMEKKFASSRDYLACLAYVADLVALGRYTVVRQTCPLDAVENAEGCWVDDIIQHSIVCNACGEAFLIWADTYHGNGGFVRECDW